MDSPMLKLLKTHNPNKEYPLNTGQKWLDNEEKELLNELHQNIDIETIANLHGRTIGGIDSRRKHIAYNLYTTGISIEEISIKTKLNIEEISEAIKRRENIIVKKQKHITPNIKIFSLENEISEIKNELKDLKSNIKELTEMLKAIYEFEDEK